MSDWIKHTGDKCPVEEGIRVDVRYRDGEEAYDVPALKNIDSMYRDAQSCFWTDEAAYNDIVEYRLAGVSCLTPNKQDPSYKYEWSLPKSQDINEGTTYVVSEPVSTNPKAALGAAKLPLSLWPGIASAYGSLAMLNGGLKYGKGNFKATPVQASIYIDAAKRHLTAWEEGQEFDPADGVPNLAGVLANVAILLEARAVGTLVDDRNISGGYLKELDELNKIVTHLQELHKDKNPRHYTLADNPK